MKTKDRIYFWIISLIWGTSFLWIKLAVGDISPTMVVAFRTLFGALGLGTIIYINKKVTLTWDMIKSHIIDFLVLGLINITLPFMLISSAQQYIDSGIASILNGANPFFTIILSPMFIKDERITFPKAIGLILGFSGVITLMAPGLQGGWNTNVMGQLMTLLAALCYAVGSIYARRKLADLPPQVSAFLQVTSAAIYTWIILLITEQPPLFPTQLLTWVSLIWLGFLGTSVAYVIYFFLLHRIGPTRISMITYVMPLFGVILGIIFLGEAFYWQVLAGMLLIISGIAITNMQKKSNIPVEN